MGAFFLVAAFLIYPLSAMAQPGGDGGRGPRQNSGLVNNENVTGIARAPARPSGFALDIDGQPVGAAAVQPRVATRQPARRRPATAGNRRVTAPRAN